MLKPYGEIKEALDKKYRTIEEGDLMDAILSGKLVMTADIEFAFTGVLKIVPQNIFKYRDNIHTLEVFTGKNCPDDPSRIDLCINRELHFPDGYGETRKLLQEYIDKFMRVSYSFFYYPERSRDRKSTRLNSSHPTTSRMPSSA